MKRILLLGGTSESRWISQLLLDRGLEVYGSVKTPSAKQLFSEGISEVFIRQSRTDSLQDFIDNRKIEMILDATHPFAAQISKKAMEICRTTNIPYLRYERPSLANHFPANRFIWVESLEAAVKLLLQTRGNILVATGAKNLEPFLTDGLRDRIFFRLLPTELGKARVDEYVLDGRVWWDGPNPSEESVRAFLKERSIRAAVVKDSGPQGISLVLAELCPPMGIYLYVLSRPRVDYPAVCSTPTALENLLPGQIFQKSGWPPGGLRACRIGNQTNRK